MDAGFWYLAFTQNDLGTKILGADGLLLRSPHHHTYYSSYARSYNNTRLRVSINQERVRRMSRPWKYGRLPVHGG